MGAVVYTLLKSAPIYQTLQINARIYVQPKASYFLMDNLVTFDWGEGIDSLKSYVLEVSYVPNPTHKGNFYSALSVKDGRAYADGHML